MKKSNYIYEPHLTVKELSLPPKGEWVPRLAGWSFIQIQHGAGYYLQPHLNQELETGTVLLISGEVQGSIRASQLGGLSLRFFSIAPARLTGLITLDEQYFLESAVSRKEFGLQIFPPDSPVAIRIGELFANRDRGGLLFRLKLLQFLPEVLGDKLGQALRDTDVSDATKRLEAFLKQTPSSELLEMDFHELAQRTNCTARHLSRIFRQLVGMPFSDKRSELRLAKAHELLATSNSKIVDVALESGFKSLSGFNRMFTRRFGVSPGRWRLKHKSDSGSLENGKNKKRFTPANHAMPAFLSHSIITSPPQMNSAVRSRVSA